MTLTLFGGAPFDQFSWEGGTVTLQRTADGQRAMLPLAYSDYTTMFGSIAFSTGQPPLTGGLTITRTGPFSAVLLTNYGTFGPVGRTIPRDKSTSTTLIGS